MVQTVENENTVIIDNGEEVNVEGRREGGRGGGGREGGEEGGREGGREGGEEGGRGGGREVRREGGEEGGRGGGREGRRGDCNKWLGRTRHPYIRAVHARYHTRTCAQIRKRCGIVT